MKLADLSATAISDGYKSQFHDFLKIWISLDEPSGIIDRLFPSEAEQLLKSSVHICQACVVLQLCTAKIEVLPSDLAFVGDRRILYRLNGFSLGKNLIGWFALPKGAKAFAWYCGEPCVLHITSSNTSIAVVGFRDKVIAERFVHDIKTHQTPQFT